MEKYETANLCHDLFLFLLTQVAPFVAVDDVMFTWACVAYVTFPWLPFERLS